jgi:hypothetical protein
VQEEVQAMVEEIDSTGNGEIQFDGEFCVSESKRFQKANEALTQTFCSAKISSG